jgi:hypothetical protein
MAGRLLTRSGQHYRLGIGATPSNPMGVFVGTGQGQAGSSALATTFKTATGANITMAQTFLPAGAATGLGGYGWAYLTSSTCLSSWMSPYSGTPYQMIIAIPMVCLDGSSVPQNTLATGAAGSQNSYWTSIATNLIAEGFSNAIIRLGWEQDGNWYPWGISVDAAYGGYSVAVAAGHFAAYWIQIVNTMRAVNGANFKFCWGPAGFSGTWLSQANLEATYPGTSYVDYMTLDPYDESWDGSIFTGGNPGNTCTVSQSNALFASLKTQTNGLNWLVTFATAQGKPFGFAECSPTIRDDTHGLGDDPTFVNNVSNWMTTTGATVMWWFSGPYDGVAHYNLLSGSFPNSLAAFKSDFG